MSSYYAVKNSNPGFDTYYVNSEDLDNHAIETAVEAAVGTLAPAAAGHVATRPGKTYVYRKMPREEFEKVMETKQMQYGTGSSARNPHKGEKWFTESMKHSREYENAGRSAVPDEVVEFELGKKGYQSDVRGSAIHQKGSRAKQPSRGRPHNVYNEERLRNHPKGKVNIGLKGRENADIFNEHVVSVKKIDPHSFMNKSTVLRWVRRNKLVVGATFIGVAVDALTLTLSIIEDGGEFGKNTILSTADIVGSTIGSAIGSAIGSLFPGVGTVVCGFVGGVIGSLIANGIASLCLYFGINTTAPGPGAPLLDTDPYDTAFGAPSIGQDPSHGPPSLGLNTGAMGVPDAQWDVGYGTPEAEWNTRDY